MASTRADQGADPRRVKRYVPEPASNVIESGSAPQPAGKRFSLIGDVDRGIGGDLAAVPQIARIRAESFRRARHEDPTGSLHRAAALRSEHPCEPRLEGIDPQRIDGVLAGGAGHDRGGPRGSGRDQADRDGQRDGPGMHRGGRRSDSRRGSVADHLPVERTLGQAGLTGRGEWSSMRGSSAEDLVGRCQWYRHRKPASALQPWHPSFGS